MPNLQMAKYRDSYLQFLAHRLLLLLLHDNLLLLLLFSIIINYYYYYVTGREQVSVGVVPMMKASGKGLSGAQSALSVYPIAIANCAEKR